MPSMGQVQKMEQLLDESKEQSLDKDFLKNLAKDFKWAFLCEVNLLALRLLLLYRW